MLFPDDFRRMIEKRFQNQHRRWLDGEGSWPWPLPLDAPTQRWASDHWPEVRDWVEAWKREQARVDWEDRDWPVLGRQRLPTRVTLASPAEVAVSLRRSAEWNLAAERAAVLTSMWPVLSGRLGWAYDELAAWSAEDFRRLLALTGWCLEHPEPQIFPRQIPVTGIHTKWLEDRGRFLAKLARSIDPRPERNSDLKSWAGLLTPPSQVRIRVLDPHLSTAVGGLTDVTAGIDEWNTLSWEPKTVLLIENHTTGTVLPPMLNTVAVIGLGNAVSTIAGWPWLKSATLWYWGDIDTYGLVILGRARTVLGPLSSFLMDEKTLLDGRGLWSDESRQDVTSPPQSLTNAEADLLAGLRSHRWGMNVRLEQERILWNTVIDALGERFELL